MLTYHGKSAYAGIAIGKLQLWEKTKNKEIEKYYIENVSNELARFNEALTEAKKQLTLLQEKAVLEVGEENANIFEIHKIMLEDEDFISLITDKIKDQNINAECAVSSSCKTFVELFENMNDPYMQARAIDVKDISQRLIDVMSKTSRNIESYNEPVILVAEDFTPSETLQMDKSKILAFITAKGSLNSHTAILARTMNIPAIIGVNLSFDKDMNERLAIIDGYSGTIYIDPDEDILSKSYNQLKEDKESRVFLQNLKGKENITLDGKKVKLFANIGNIKDISSVLDNDAGGIGLFRSEFIFLEKNTFPSEEEQFAIYKNAVETMNGKKVIIRTLDIGADKKVEYFNLKPEENPALGLRGIRLCLNRPDIFKTQLRALLRASIYGNLSIMYPMVSSVKEVVKIKEFLLMVASELDAQNIPYKIPEQGIMIETPASVMISEELAKEVEFFSIGTNDLSQYTMAIDRQNDDLDDFFDPYHPAVLKMIELTIKNAHNAGIWVGICGELAADTELTKKFLDLGIDELSVSPGRVLSIRKTIREINLTNK